MSYYRYTSSKLFFMNSACPAHLMISDCSHPWNWKVMGPIERSRGATSALSLFKYLGWDLTHTVKRIINVANGEWWRSMALR